MKNTDKYDAVIIGAGPAGSTIACRLAQQNARVLIVEKRSFPRYKACGGGLTQRAWSLLPFDISRVVEDETFSPKMLLNDRLIFSEDFSNPIIKMVMRDKFDAFLVEKAADAGASFMDNTSFTELRGKPGDLTIITTKGKVKSRYLVAADGVFSRTARALGLRTSCSYMTAIEGETYFRKDHFLDRFKRRVHFDFGVIPGGYGWIFPKKDHLSIGLVTTFSRIKNWKAYFGAYLKLKGIKSLERINPLQGHLIPFNPEKSNILSNEKGLAAGDAAGFTDPLTGEGIYYALMQAELAGPAIFDSLCKGPSAMPGYTKVIRKEFTRDMICARRMSAIMFGYPAFARFILTRLGRTAARAQLGVISGEISPAKLFDNIIKSILDFSLLRSMIQNQ